MSESGVPAAFCVSEEWSGEISSDCHPAIDGTISDSARRSGEDLPLYVIRPGLDIMMKAFGLSG
jgi:hypothetical protein